MKDLRSLILGSVDSISNKLNSGQAVLVSWARSALGELQSTRMPSRLLIVAMCAVLLGIGVALVQTIAAERRARVQVEVTTDVLSLLRRSLIAGIDAETGQRGYLLTGDRVFLQPYERGSQAWLPAIVALRSVLGDSAAPEEEAAIGRLEQLATLRLAILEETIALARAGRRDEASAAVAEKWGKRVMDEYRTTVGALEERQASRQSQAIENALAVETRAVPIIFLLGASIFGLIIAGLWMERRTARAEAAVREAQQLRTAHDSCSLLARELNHRVKNLFSVILSLVTLSGRGETDVKKVISSIHSRIYALSLAHTASQGRSHEIVSLDELVAAILKPYAAVQGRVTLEGEAVPLPARTATPIGLLIHELATNAVKYGALSIAGGRLDVRWTTRHAKGGGEIELVWEEHGGPAVAHERQEGFGSVLIEQAALQMGGTVEREWLVDGVRARLVFPVGASR